MSNIFVTIAKYIGQNIIKVYLQGLQGFWELQVYQF